MRPTHQAPAVTLLAAVSDDGFISTGTGVPWDLPADREHFRSRASGRWLLVGRRTYLEMTGWFSDHHPLVLSRDSDFHPRPGQRVTSVSEAIARTIDAGVGELVVIGGGQVYAAAMPWATRLDLTLVHSNLGGGVAFPVIDQSQWTFVTKRSHPADDRHAVSFTFTEATRVNANGSDV